MQKIISEPSTAQRPLHLLGTRNCSVALQSKNSALSDANTSLLQHHYCSYVSQMNDVGLISFLNQTQQATPRTIANTYKLMEPTFCSKQIFKATIFFNLRPHFNFKEWICKAVIHYEYIFSLVGFNEGRRILEGKRAAVQ